MNFHVYEMSQQSGLDTNRWRRLPLLFKTQTTNVKRRQVRIISGWLLVTWCSYRIRWKSVAVFRNFVWDTDKGIRCRLYFWFCFQNLTLIHLHSCIGVRRFSVRATLDILIGAEWYRRNVESLDLTCIVCSICTRRVCGSSEALMFMRFQLLLWRCLCRHNDIICCCCCSNSYCPCRLYSPDCTSAPFARSGKDWN